MAAALALRILAGGLLVLSNGFFVTTEFALTRIRQFERDQVRGPGLDLAWRMTERLELYLSGCQLGITVSSVGLGVVAEPALAEALHPILVAVGLAPQTPAGHGLLAAGLGLAIINLAHVVLGEQAPTYLGIERARWVARWGARPLYWWTKATWPVIVVADRIAKGLLGLFGVTITRSWTEAEEEEEAEVPATRGELRSRMGAALRRMGVPSDRRDEVLSAFEIGETPVRDIMVPRDEIVALRAGDDVRANLQRVREHPHVRFPLVGDTLEDYRGVVYLPALLRKLDGVRSGAVTLEDVAAPPFSADAGTPVSTLIDRFQAEHHELALVVEDDEVVGLVTATDAFEAIAGELEDPLDREGG